MAVPDPYVTNKCVGRYGSTSLHCNWTAQENDDLSEYVVLDPTRDLQGVYENESVSVLRIFWAASENLRGVLKFDSLGDRGEILVIPAGVTEGHRDFTVEVDGCRPDPDRSMPSNVVFSTDDALSTDRVRFDFDYKVSGQHKP